MIIYSTSNVVRSGHDGLVAPGGADGLRVIVGGTELVDLAGGGVDDDEHLAGVGVEDPGLESAGVLDVSVVSGGPGVVIDGIVVEGSAGDERAVLVLDAARVDELTLNREVSINVALARSLHSVSSHVATRIQRHYNVEMIFEDTLRRGRAGRFRCTWQ